MSGLLLVHAHPDDEAIATGGVMARAHDEGRRVVLVTCTGGEAGEIHNMDEAAVRPRLAAVRRGELEAAASILGVSRLIMLGYRDSGMAGTLDNEDPASFHLADLDLAAGRVAEVIRQERPEVVVTYGPDGIYGHPDHVQAHHVTVRAADILEAEGQLFRLYFVAIPRSGMERMAERMRAAGLATPFEGEVESGIRIEGTPDEEITTVVDVGPQVARKKDAFAAHVSQNDPGSFFLNTPPEIFDEAFGTECFVLARGGEPAGRPETGLFASSAADATGARPGPPADPGRPDPSPS
ncbi:MAG: PIG-L family deacetylase [Candidatus Dormibacteraceae bacterium]